MGTPCAVVIGADSVFKSSVLDLLNAACSCNDDFDRAIMYTSGCSTTNSTSIFFP